MRQRRVVVFLYGHAGEERRFPLWYYGLRDVYKGQLSLCVYLSVSLGLSVSLCVSLCLSVSLCVSLSIPGFIAQEGRGDLLVPGTVRNLRRTRARHSILS